MAQTRIDSIAAKKIIGPYFEQLHTAAIAHDNNTVQNVAKKIVALLTEETEDFNLAKELAAYQDKNHQCNILELLTTYGCIDETKQLLECFDWRIKDQLLLRPKFQLEHYMNQTAGAYDSISMHNAVIYATSHYPDLINHVSTYAESNPSELALRWGDYESLSTLQAAGGRQRENIPPMFEDTFDNRFIGELSLTEIESTNKNQKQAPPKKRTRTDSDEEPPAKMAYPTNNRNTFFETHTASSSSSQNASTSRGNEMNVDDMLKLRESSVKVVVSNNRIQ